MSSEQCYIDMGLPDLRFVLRASDNGQDHSSSLADMKSPVVVVREHERLCVFLYVQGGGDDRDLSKYPWRCNAQQLTSQAMDLNLIRQASNSLLLGRGFSTSVV